MRFNIKISKKMITRLMVFAALVGAAMVFDVYFENHPGALKELQASGKKTESEHCVVYLFSQTTSFSVKSPAQKTPNRKLITQAHDKYIRKCHQIRDLQAYKAESSVPRRPVYLSCHNLLFRQHYFSFSDDESIFS